MIVYRHTVVLPGRGNVQSGLAVSPFTEAKLYPSTDWEETFPSALSLTAQCHNYTMCLHRSLRKTSSTWTSVDSTELPVHFPLTVGDNTQLSFTFFPSQQDQSPPSPFLFLRHLDASRREQPNVGRREADQPKHWRTFNGVKPSCHQNTTSV